MSTEFRGHPTLIINLIEMDKKKCSKSLFVYKIGWSGRKKHLTLLSLLLLFKCKIFYLTIICLHYCIKEEIKQVLCFFFCVAQYYTVRRPYEGFRHPNQRAPD